MQEKLKFMKEAYRQAKKAEKLNEVPIGCVIVFEDKVIARGYNRRNPDKNTLAHAEISAIKKAVNTLLYFCTNAFIFILPFYSLSLSPHTAENYSD